VVGLEWYPCCTLQPAACNTDTTPTQPHRKSNTHRTKNNTTNVVIQQKLVFYSSTNMHTIGDFFPTHLSLFSKTHTHTHIYIYICMYVGGFDGQGVEVTV